MDIGRRKTIKSLQKIKLENLISTILVPNHNKKYKTICEQWRQIGNVNKSQLIKFIYHHRTNYLCFHDEYDYIEIPPYFLSLISLSTTPSIKTLQFQIFDVAKFCKTATGRHFNKIKLRINDCEFKLHLFPNGISQAHQGFVQYFIELTKLPINAISVVVYVQLCCAQTVTEFKQTNVFKDIHDFKHLWPSLSTQECEKWWMLQFKYRISILQIHYNSSIEHYSDNFTIKTTQTIECKWDWYLIKAILSKIKRSTHDFRFFSGNIGDGDMFCFAIESNGVGTENKHIDISLNLLKLPFNIDRITVLFKFKMGAPEYSNTFKLSYKTTKCKLKLIPQDVEWLLLANHDDLDFTFSVKIIEQSTRSNISELNKEIDDIDDVVENNDNCQDDDHMDGDLDKLFIDRDQSNDINDDIDEDDNYHSDKMANDIMTNINNTERKYVDNHSNVIGDRQIADVFNNDIAADSDIIHEITKIESIPNIKPDIADNAIKTNQQYQNIKVIHQKKGKKTKVSQYGETDKLITKQNDKYLKEYNDRHPEFKNEDDIKLEQFQSILNRECIEEEIGFLHEAEAIKIGCILIQKTSSDIIKMTSERALEEKYKPKPLIEDKKPALQDGIEQIIEDKKMEKMHKIIEDMNNMDIYEEIKELGSTDILEIKQMTDFCKAGVGKKFIRKKLQIEQFGLKIYIYPNGINDRNKGFIQYIVKFKQIPADIKSFMVYCQLLCIESNTEYRCTQKCNNNQDFIGWWSSLLPLTDCKQFNQLHFKYDIKILQICYDRNTITDHVKFENNLQPLLNIEYVWHIEKTIFTTMKYCKYISMFYNQTAIYDGFCVSLGCLGSEFGRNKKKNKKINVSFHILKLPPQIEKMSALCELSIDSNPKIKKQKEHIFDYNSTQCVITLDKKYSDRLFEGLDQIRILFVIRINKLWFRDFMDTPHELQRNSTDHDILTKITKKTKPNNQSKAKLKSKSIAPEKSTKGAKLIETLDEIKKNEQKEIDEEIENKKEEQKSNELNHIDNKIKEMQSKYHKILNERDNLIQKCSNLERIIIENSKQEKKLRIKCDELNKQNHKLKDGMNDKDQELEHLRFKLNKQHQNELKQREQEWMKNKNDMRKTWNVSYNELKKEKEKQIKRLTENKSELKIKVKKLSKENKKIDKLQQTINNQQTINETLKFEMKTLRITINELKEIETDRNELQYKYQGLQDRNNRLQHIIQSQQSKMHKINEKRESLEIRNENVLASHNALSSELDELKMRNKNIKDQHIALEMKYDDLTEKYYKLEGKYTEMMNKRDEEDVVTVVTDINVGKECLICFGHGRTNACVPCGHLCVCDECKDGYCNNYKTCPLCDTKYTSIIKIFA